MFVVPLQISLLKIKNEKNLSSILEKVRSFLVIYIGLLKNITDIAMPETKFYIDMKSAGYFKTGK